MNARLHFIVASFVCFLCYSAIAGLRLRDGEYCFCNRSTNEIVVMDLRADGKELRSCGVVVPNGDASVYDEEMFPYTLPRAFQIGEEDLISSWYAKNLQIPNKNLFLPKDRFVSCFRAYTQKMYVAGLTGNRPSRRKVSECGGGDTAYGTSNRLRTSIAIRKISARPKAVSRRLAPALHDASVEWAVAILFCNLWAIGLQLLAL